MSDPFNSKTDAIPENALEELVGEGKKFSDAEALAKSKFEADVFIEKLKQEAEERANTMAELEKEVLKGQGAREIYDQLSKQNQNQAPESIETKEGKPADTSEVDINELLEQKLNERDERSAIRRNVEESASVLRSKFGDNLGEVINKKAEALGMTADDLKKMAGTSPKIFVELVGGGNTQSSVPSSVSPSTIVVNGVSSHRNNEYYSNLAKTKPSEYHKPSTRAQMMKDADEQGENFYKT